QPVPARGRPDGPRCAQEGRRRRRADGLGEHGDSRSRVQRDRREDARRPARRRAAAHDVHGRLPAGGRRASARPSLRGVVLHARGRGRRRRRRRPLRASPRRCVLDRGGLRARVLRSEGRPRAVARDVRAGAAGATLISVRARLGLPGGSGPLQGGRGMSHTRARVLDDLELYTRIYGRMLLIRGFEDLVQALFLKGEVYGTTHLYSGQEAVATGVASLLEDRDRVAATYRGHGHALALGVDPQALLDEMLGRATGVNGGRAGSMNVASPANRLIGSFGIVGGSIAAATGAALALKRTTGGVGVASFGGGGMKRGYGVEWRHFDAGGV